MNNYMPAADAAFDQWGSNFAGLITANPASYGLVAGDALTIQTSYNAWHAAYLLVTVPATATAPNVAAKDNARADFELVARPYAQQVKNNTGVDPMLKVGLQIGVRQSSTTPIAAPTSFPVIQLKNGTPGVANMMYQDSEASSGKAKPYGVIGVELVGVFGTAPSVDVTQGRSIGLVTKSPFKLKFTQEQRGKIATIWGRYYTKSGPGGVVQFGDWSASVSFTTM